MCGIVGMLAPGGVPPQTLTAMRDALAHRGPDDAGNWISPDGTVGLAQRRLSIIDLSAAGHQPMTNEDGTLWLVFNGEIYNYRELQADLTGRGHRFASHCDAESILHGYEEWGTGILTRLRGMFAFGLWDGPRRRLVVARDHTGIKPMFTYWDGRTLAFASELKAFWKAGALDRAHDRSALFDYLTYGYIPAPKTAYRCVRKLLPGHVLTVDGAKPSIAPYWDVPLEEDPGLDDAGALRAVEEGLAEAVRLNMVADVPVGLFLSGGLDSTTVLAHMGAETREPVRAYSIGFDVTEHTETGYARLAAQTFGARYEERTVGRESVRDLLPALVRMYDEPYADTSALPTLRVAELARRDVKVVLAGDGGDEVFAGYRWYDRWLQQQRLKARVPRFLQTSVLAPLGRAWPEGVRGTDLKHLLEHVADDPLVQYARQLEIFSPVLKRRVLGAEWAAEFEEYDDYWAFRRWWRPALPAITRMQYLDLKTYLPDQVLTKVDRATMAVGLESRPPLLDHPLIELAFRVPASVRFRNAEKKHLLKRAMADRLPRAILDRPKKGFSSPMMQWMQADRAFVEERLLRPDGVAQLPSLSALGHRGFGARCWALLVLEQWKADEGGFR